MSRSRKKVCHSTWAVTNHRVQSRYYTMIRRQCRRTSNQYLKTHWHEDDMVMPSHLPRYSSWLSPGDGCFIWWTPPKFNNPYENSGFKKPELVLWKDALALDAVRLGQYHKYLRK